jgi:hypothetical protein
MELETNLMNHYGNLILPENESYSRFDTQEDNLSGYDDTALTVQEDIPISYYMMEFFMV